MLRLTLGGEPRPAAVARHPGCHSAACWTSELNRSGDAGRVPPGSDLARIGAAKTVPAEGAKGATVATTVSALMFDPSTAIPVISAAGVWAVDPDLVTLFVSPGFPRLVGIWTCPGLTDRLVRPRRRRCLDGTVRSTWG